MCASTLLLWQSCDQLALRQGLTRAQGKGRLHTNVTHLKKGVLLGSVLKAACPDCTGNRSWSHLPPLKRDLEQEHHMWLAGTWSMLKEVEAPLRKGAELGFH